MRLRLLAAMVGVSLLFLVSSVLAQGPEPTSEEPSPLLYAPAKERLFEEMGPSGLPGVPEGGLGTEGAVGPLGVALGDPGLSFRYVSSFGETEVAYFADSSHLNYPYGVGLDGSGNLWVTEQLGARAMKYDGNGAFLMSIGKAGMMAYVNDELLMSPADVRVDGAGNVWVADQNGQRVAKYDSSGNYLTQLGVSARSGSDNAHFYGPVSLAFDSAGGIYVSDAWNYRIQVFDSSGTYSTTIGVTGAPGSDNAHFKGPRHIAIDSADNLYVPDAGNHRVQIFDSSHSYVATLGVTGVSGSDNSHLNWPLGIDVDANYIYVAECDNHRVQIFDRTTRTYKYTIGTGSAGSGNAQFSCAGDVAVDSTGNIYVTDLNNYRVQKFNSSRAYVRTFGTTGVPYLTDGYHYNEPTGVEIDSVDRIGIVEDFNVGHRFVRLGTGGAPQITIGQPGVPGWDNAHLWDPHAVAFDASNRIYIADTSNDRVQILNANGTYNATLGWGSTSDYQFDEPSGIAVGGDGRIYVADTNNHRVQIYDSNRQYVATIGDTGVCGDDNSHLCYPYGVDVDGSGNIYVADASNQRVQKFNSNRVWQMTLGTTGEYGWDFDHFYLPWDVAADSVGRIYVAERNGNRVQVFDNGGAYLTTIGGDWDKQPGRFRGPSAVDVDSSGNVYVADQLNHRVQKFVPGVPYWTQTNINGFGDMDNQLATALAPFNGHLCAGTYNWDSGAEVWCRDSDWEMVNTSGFNDADNEYVDHLLEFDGYLYASTGNDTDGGEVWRYNGSSWSQVASGGFGDTSNAEVFRFGLFHDTLYASTWSYTDTHGTEVYTTTNGTSWTKAVSNGFGDSNNEAALCFEESSGYLYTGTCNDSTGGEVWRTSDGSSWTQVNSDGFGDGTNWGVSALAALNGYLYASTRPYEGAGAEVWRCQDCDGSDWAQVVDDGFGNEDTRGMSALEVLRDQLYLVVGNSETGLEVWRSSNGTDWEQTGFAGFGDSSNLAPYWDNSVAVLDEELYIGTYNWAQGGEVWKMWRPSFVPLVMKAF